MHAAFALLGRTRRVVRSWSEAVLLLRIVCVMGALPLLARLETMRLLRLLETVSAWIGAGRRWSDDEVVLMVRRCGGLHRWAFQDNCVSQSLTLFALLNRHDAPLDVVFGVDVAESGADGPRLGRRHVWLERDGLPVFERQALLPYVTQTRYRTHREAPGRAGSTAGLVPLLGAYGASSAGTALLSLSTVARMKIVAIVAGPAGLAVFGQLSSAMQGLSWLSTLGASAATTRQVSEALEAGDAARAGSAVRTAAALLGGLALLLGAIAVAWAAPLSVWVFGAAGTPLWTTLLAATVPALATLSLTTAILRGARLAVRLATAQAVGAVLSVVSAVVLVRPASLSTVVAAGVLATVVQAIALAAAAWPVARAWTPGSAAWQGDVAREIAGYGAANVAMGLATAIGGLTIGRAYLAAGMLEDAGRIATLSWFGEPLAAVLVSGLFASAYPAYCAAPRGGAPGVLSKATRGFVPFASLPLLAAAAAAPLTLRLLFSERLVAVAPLLPWQLLATYVRAGSVLLGIPLLARGHVAILTVLHVAWSAAAALFAVRGLTGAAGYTWALLGASTAHALVLVGVLSALGLSQPRRDYAWLLAGAAPLLAAALLLS